MASACSTTCWSAVTVARTPACPRLDPAAVPRLAEERVSRGRARALLAQVGLTGRALEPAEGLPLADQRRLEIARALAAEPSLLLLDEPAAG